MSKYGRLREQWNSISVRKIKHTRYIDEIDHLRKFKSQYISR